MNLAPPARGPGAGLTLVEITVALAIFAVLSTLAYGGLRQLIEAQRQTERFEERLAALQMALRQVEHDLEQAAPRAIRDERGDPQPAFVGSADGALALTSASWRNPAGLSRSRLRRVVYGLQRGTLLRLTWPVLDRAPDTAPQREEILTDVVELGLRFLDQDREWRQEWPPLGRTGDEPPGSPIAVELTLELEDWGVVQRLFRLPG
jgi:general secretion pathway protein J